jgi:UDP-N-acetylmuramate: L-alanyl-gamma-D-glutamyl-meso-diaminopimelate ligase
MQNTPEKEALNRMPPLKPNAHVHLLGICGTGMAAVAGLLLESGFKVTGSDQAVYPPMSDLLNELGIPVAEGYSPANLDPRPDMAVVGNVIRRVNPEAMEAERLRIPIMSMPALVRALFAHDKTRIVVAGTHGKTTVSSMIAWILYEQGLEPGFMIGGIPSNFRRSYRSAKGPFFVIEGDEYDTAYFDKRPKFLHYDPRIAVITSCEFDHADIYDSVEQIQQQFLEFSALVPASGRLVACGDYPRVLRIIEGTKVPLSTYGSNSNTEWSFQCAQEGPEGFSASILRRGRTVASAVLPFMGFHNLLNATAAIAACEAAGVSPDSAMKALETFQGVKRRQEILGIEQGVVLIDDFAHHPSAVKVTCAAVRHRFANHRLIAVFEPRTNTSRRGIFQQDYVEAFLKPDLVLLREPRRVEDLHESDRFSSRRLAEDLRTRGKVALAFDDTDGILDYLAQEIQPGDVVLIMSNGSFDDVGARLLRILRERGQ